MPALLSKFQAEQAVASQSDGAAAAAIDVSAAAAAAEMVFTYVVAANMW